MTGNRGYPVAYRSAASVYQPTASLSNAGALVPVPSASGYNKSTDAGFGSVDYIPQPGLDYVPDKGTSSSYNKSSDVGYGNPSRKYPPPPTMIGGTAISPLLRAVGGVSAIGNAASALSATFAAAMFLRRQLYVPSNYTVSCSVGEVFDGFRNSGINCGTQFNGDIANTFPQPNPAWLNVGVVRTMGTSVLGPNFRLYLQVIRLARTVAGAAPQRYDQLAPNLWTANFPYAQLQPIAQPRALPQSTPFGLPGADAGYAPPGGGAKVATLPFGRPPPRRTKEKKFRANSLAHVILRRAFGPAMNAVTESCDAIEAIYNALPKDKQKPVVMKRTADGKVVRPGQPGFQSKSSKWITPGCREQAKIIWRESDHIDWTKALANMASNDAQDKVIGKTNQDAQQSLNQSGWSREPGIGWGPVF